MSDGLRFEQLYGSDIAARVPELAELRMTVFRDWPYLYEGDHGYERRYLRYYVDTRRAFALLVFDDDHKKWGQSKLFCTGADSIRLN